MGEEVKQLAFSFMNELSKKASKKESNETGRKMPLGKMFGYTFIALIIIFAVINFGAVKLFAEHQISKISPFVSNVSQQISQQISPEYYYTAWSKPTIAQEAQSYVQASFRNTIVKNNEVNVIAELAVKNPEFDSFEVNAECYAGTEKIDANPKILYFEKSADEQHASVTCSGTSSEKNLILKLERPSTVKSTAIAWIGEGGSRGKMKSSMGFNSLYALSVESSDDMPFKEGKEYPVYITFMRQSAGIELKQINLLKIGTDTVKIITSCDGFEQRGALAQIENVENVNEFLADKDEGIYQFLCSLYVEDAEQLEQYYINAEAVYATTQEFKTALTQQT